MWVGDVERAVALGVVATEGSGPEEKEERERLDVRVVRLVDGGVEGDEVGIKV